MVVAELLIHAVDGRLAALAAIGQAKELARVAMEMVFLPLVGVHVLIGIVEVSAFKGTRFLEAIGRRGEIDEQNEQQQGDAEAEKGSSNVKPKTVFFCLAHKDGLSACKTNGNNRKGQKDGRYL